MLKKDAIAMVSMNWENVLFAHWTMHPEVVQKKLPKGMKVDTYNGKAYIGVVSFLMNKIHPTILPEMISFSLPEINVRTYVEVDGKKGVFFFSLDTESRMSVLGANIFVDMPYYYSDIHMETKKDQVFFESKRKSSEAIFKGNYLPNGEVFKAEKDSLEFWLTERYRLYQTKKNGEIQYGDIKHEQWPLQYATLSVEKNTLVEAADFNLPNSQPHLLYSPKVSVDIGQIKKY
ncbi:DUF2071 domain-containing protein [Alkalihalophilus lindianensis]|uniref:DUF2071 domain-containing protein n=1 Tax=Alkalihalophilus lindianensis TaxID=1630542 RepID=A0ABU3X696_9BACI|nr:DUF2071 domain-containing protein [Alkalihalophilus lindianensis]MDV2683323.1 DUF2071 domain-containing protein [Alkalihalophilus lindianensis]